jgi:hypothetical protein
MGAGHVFGVLQEKDGAHQARQEENKREVTFVYFNGSV